MLTNRIAVLACLMVAMTLVGTSGCGGRTNLDDFADGADNLLPGSQGGAQITNEATATNGDGDAGAVDTDKGDADTGPAVPGPADRGELGAPCMGDKACNGDTSICLKEIEISDETSVEFPGGYCAIQDCASDEDCPEGTGCLFGFGVQTCMQRCDGDSDCRTAEAYGCSALEGSMDPDTFCLPSDGGGGDGDGQTTGGDGISELCDQFCMNNEEARLECIATNSVRPCFRGGQGGTRGQN